jgi:hypothetical protein
VLERIDLTPNSVWSLEAKRETWLLVLSGGAAVGSFDVATADAIFAQSDHADIYVGKIGMMGLVAYTGIGPVSNLLRRVTQAGPTDSRRQQKVQLPHIPHTRARSAPTDGRQETTK